MPKETADRTGRGAHDPWWAAVMCAVVAVLVSFATRVQTSEQDQQIPRFRSSIDIGRVTVRVLDANRRPVRDLTADDFIVLLDGERKRLVAFATDEISPDPVTEALWTRAIAPDVASNRLLNPRLVVVILDDGLIPFDPWILKTAKSIASKTIDQLTRDDLAAIVFTRDNRAPQEFTADKARLLAAVNRLDYGFNRRNKVELQYAQMRSLDVLRRNIELLRSIPEWRSLIVWVTIGWPDPLEYTAPRFAGLGTTELPDTEAALDLSASLASGLATGRVAGIPVYAVSPLGLVPDTPSIPNPNMFAGGPIGSGGVSARDAFGMTGLLRGISHATGGRAIVQTNAPADGVTDVFKENTFHYTLGYEAPGALVDGRYHRIEVRATRPGVSVEPGGARTFLAPKAGAVPTPTTAASRALAGLIPLADEPLSLACAALADPAGAKNGAVQARLLLALGVDVPAASELGEEIELEVRVFDSEGRRQIDMRKHTAHVGPATPTRDRSYDFLLTLSLPPSRYNLRVSAHSTTRNRTGSVFTDITIPDYSKAAVSMSDLLVGAEPGRTATPLSATADLQAVVPTTLRAFERTARATVFARVYWGRLSAAPLPVSMFATIVDATNVEVFDQTTPLAPIQALPLPSADYQLELPLQTLKSGEYLLTLRLKPQGTGEIVRHVRFVVR